VDLSGLMPPVVLSLNVGSSSLKAAIRDPDMRMHVELAGLDGATGHLTVSGTGSFVERMIVRDGWTSAMAAVADTVARHGLHPQVVVHRIVHSSALLDEPRAADDVLLERLRAEEHQDPLHLPRQLGVVDEARRLWPDALVVLVPDNLFHRSLPDEAVTLPLPSEAREAGLRRWGFHGLAVQSVVDRLPDLGCGVVVHLGSGCSVTAVADGVSQHTSMAVSPAGGIPSLTRSGDLDPEVVLRLVESADGSVSPVRRLLNERSGVAGLSGGRTDVQNMLVDGDAAADLALRVFVRHVAMAVAGAVTTLEQWDSLVFSGGIGVHSAELRERICARLLVLRPDAADRNGAPSERLAAAGVRVHVLPVDEEAVLDRLARAVAARPPAATWSHPAAARGRPR
jgi:acetate kinase